MSIQAIMRPFVAVATLTLAASALAAPAPRTYPMPKQAADAARRCDRGVPAPGQREGHPRFGVFSHTDTRSVPAC